MNECQMNTLSSDASSIVFPQWLQFTSLLWATVFLMSHFFQKTELEYFYISTQKEQPIKYKHVQKQAHHGTSTGE